MLDICQRPEALKVVKAYPIGDENGLHVRILVYTTHVFGRLHDGSLAMEPYTIAPTEDGAKYWAESHLKAAKKKAGA